MTNGDLAARAIGDDGLGIFERAGAGGGVTHMADGRVAGQARQVAAALATELEAMASWLDLAKMSVGERGDLAAALAHVLG